MEQQGEQLVLRQFRESSSPYSNFLIFIIASSQLPDSIRVESVGGAFNCLMKES